MKKHLLATLIVATIVGCSKDNVDIETNNNIVKFNSEKIDTRVSDDGEKWSANDAIGITKVIVTSTLLEYDTEQVETKNENIKYISDNSEEAADVDFNVAEGYSPITTSNSGYSKFYAYYPYQEDMVSDSFIYSSNVADQSENIDFMVGASEVVDYSQQFIGFTFSHQLAKIILYITPKDNITSLSGHQVSITGLSTMGEYDIRTGSLSGSLSGSATPISFVMQEYVIVDGSDPISYTLASKTDTQIDMVTATVIVHPELLSSDAALTFTQDDRTFSASIKSGTELLSSKTHSYNITVGNDIAGFSSSTISSWESATETPDTSIFPTETVN